MDPVQSLKENPFLLAPMAAITDCPFRTLMRDMGCGAVITELISAQGLIYNSEKTIQLMDFTSNQHPVGIQLFGDSPESIAQAAQKAQETGADFIDLNFGCPVPKVVKKGGGSAILRDLERVKNTFRQVKSALKIPLTAKIRTGWDHQSRNADEVAKIAFDEGLAWIAIHGRTRAQGYEGLADWEYIGEVKAKSQIPIIGNGDIVSAQQAVQRLSQYALDGVMIGRGCLKNPWIFKEALSLWKSKPDSATAVSEQHKARNMENLMLQLRDLYSVARHGRQPDAKITQIQLRKFASWYSTGYPGASVFRKALFQTESVDQTLDLSLGFFRSLSECAQADTSQEAFLMGGHG